jgi:hypothetical protein
MDVSCHPHVLAALTAGKTPGNNWIGGRVGPIACLVAVEEEMYFPCRESNLDTLVEYPVPSCYLIIQLKFKFSGVNCIIRTSFLSNILNGISRNV